MTFNSNQNMDFGRSAVLKIRLMSMLFVIAVASLSYGQTNSTSIISQPESSKPVYRTIITYNGVVCLATPNYDLMTNGQIVFKNQGMRFDGSGYFWSPAIRDNPVRRNRYGGRIVGTTKQYWPPLTQTGTPPANQFTFQPNTNPYFGSKTTKTNRNPYFGTGTQTVTRRETRLPTRATPTQQTSPRFVQCPNGSYAVICR